FSACNLYKQVLGAAGLHSSQNLDTPGQEREEIENSQTGNRMSLARELFDPSFVRDLPAVILILMKFNVVI
ncbi:hypothetical protein THAOC_00302, partial [Thalassiosira oceanica]